MAPSLAASLIAGAVFTFGFASGGSAAPYASSLSPARQAAQRRAFSNGAPSATARPNQPQRTNFIGKSQIPVATRPSTQIPVATKPQTQIPFQKTPGPSVVTPPMTKPLGNYEPTTLMGFYPVMKSNQSAIKQQAVHGDTRHSTHVRANLHPERVWQSATTGGARAFMRNYKPTK
jgi:hypothetical protein